eukprot:COSAG06_NODE_57988_length_278_cov_1.033520_1_plen_44_part_01
MGGGNGLLSRPAPQTNSPQNLGTTIFSPPRTKSRRPTETKGRET